MTSDMLATYAPQQIFTCCVRRDLVNRPFPRVNYYPGKSWAGRFIHERVPAYGRRMWAPSWDEEWFAKPEEGDV